MRKTAHLHHLLIICDRKLTLDFKNQLKTNKRELSFKLISQLTSNITINDIDLIKHIYNCYNKKNLKRFNQLYHHTFNLYGKFLIENHPDFLSFSVLNINSLFNDNKIEEAQNYINSSIYIAEKIEDFEFLMIFINLLRRLGITIQKSKFSAVEHINILENLTEIQTIKIKDYLTKKTSPNEIEIINLKKLFHHPSKSVQFLSMQTYLYIISNYSLNLFYTNESKLLIEKCLSIIKKFPYLKIFSNNKYVLSIEYLNLKFNQNYLNLKTVNSVLKSNLEKKLNYENIMYTLSIKGSCYLTNYLFDLKNKQIISEIKDDLNTIKLIEIKFRKKHENSIIQYLHFKIIKSVFLLLNDDAVNSIKNLESTIFQLQQQSFKKFYDEIFILIFLNLIALEQYDKIIDQFKRYKKIVKNNTSIKENYIMIHILYYSVLYLTSNKKSTKTKILHYYNELIENNSKENQNIILLDRIWSMLKIKPLD